MKNICNLYQEQNFHIVKDNNQLFIIISNYEKVPVNPEIAYDGKEHAILYRNEETTILLDYINPIIRNDLLSAQSVKVVETKEIKNKIVSVLNYDVELRIVKYIPKNINIITPNKFMKKQKTMDKTTV